MAVVSAACVLLSPLLLGIGAAAGALTGRPQPLIVARLTVAYFAHELGVLVACGLLWVAAGGGRLIGADRWQLLHWRLFGWFFCGLAVGRPPDAWDRRAPRGLDGGGSALESDQPLLVFSRHAGPGDTIFVGGRADLALSTATQRRVQGEPGLDPCVDLLAHRLPQAMLDTSDRDECEARIKELTAELGPRGALLLFPEGGNFTRERRRSALRRLWRKGRRSAAARAESMPHVLPPQPGGALAALSARPDADIVFAAHTGLGLAAYPRQFWREMPTGRTLHTRLWLAPASDVPAGDDERVSWLYDWWERIDDWVDGEHAELGRARRHVKLAVGSQAAAGCLARPVRVGRTASGEAAAVPIHLLNASGASGFEKW